MSAANFIVVAIAAARHRRERDAARRMAQTIPSYSPPECPVNPEDGCGDAECHRCGTRQFPTEVAIERVKRILPWPNNTRSDAMNYIRRLAPNLICLDCGSENHTRGHDLCQNPT